MIDKPGKGAFYQTDLELMLKNRGIETLLVCGVTTEVCVNTTVREANDRGFRCVVLSDCCASYFPEFHDVGLKMIKAQGGIFGSVSASAAAIAALAAPASCRALVAPRAGIFLSSQNQIRGTRAAAFALWLAAPKFAALSNPMNNRGISC